MLKLKTGKFLGNNKSIFQNGGIIVSETEYHQKVFEGWHAHDNYHLTFILRGGNCEQRKGTEIQSTPGTLLFYRRGEFHRNTATLHPSKNLNLEITDKFLVKYEARFPAFDSNFRQSAKFSLLKIYKEFFTNDSQTSDAIHSLTLALLDSPFEDKSLNKTPTWIKTMREILNDRWNEVISLDELSQLVGVHPVTISKKFPKYFACTLGEYIRKIKVEKSLDLLVQPHLNLSEITYLCGFADQSHLTRVFKSSTGFTPLEFRKYLRG